MRRAGLSGADTVHVIGGGPIGLAVALMVMFSAIGAVSFSGVFGAAPRELARVISLEQTVDLVRTTVAVVESAIERLATQYGRYAYRRIRRMLVDEFGLEPSREMQRLQQQILAQDHALDVRPSAAPKSNIVPRRLQVLPLGDQIQVVWTERVRAMTPGFTEYFALYASALAASH